MSFWEWFSVKYHRHQWEAIETISLKVYETGFVGNPDKIIASGNRIVLQCKICGEIKYKDLV